MSPAATVRVASSLVTSPGARDLAARMMRRLFGFDRSMVDGEHSYF